jgi:hypothetical protein
MPDEAADEVALRHESTGDQRVPEHKIAAVIFFFGIMVLSIVGMIVLIVFLVGALRA